MRLLAISLTFLAVLLTAAVHAGNGPLAWADREWRGAGRGAGRPNGARRKNVKWKVDLPGRENSSPVVWGGESFSRPRKSSNRQEGGLPKLAFKLLCFDRNHGKLRWSRPPSLPDRIRGRMAQTASPRRPVHRREFVYATSALEDFIAIDGRKSRWKKDDFGQMDTLIISAKAVRPRWRTTRFWFPGTIRASALYALDRRTGEKIWKQNRDEPTGWANAARRRACGWGSRSS